MTKISSVLSVWNPVLRKSAPRIGISPNTGNALMSVVTLFLMRPPMAKLWPSYNCTVVEDLDEVIGLFAVDSDELAGRASERVDQSYAATQEIRQQAVGPAAIGSLQLQACAQLVDQCFRDFRHFDLEQHLLRRVHGKQ